MPTRREQLTRILEQLVKVSRTINKNSPYVAVESEDADGTIRNDNIEKERYDELKQSIEDNGGKVLVAVDEKGNLIERYRRPFQEALDGMHKEAFDKFTSFDHGHRHAFGEEHEMTTIDEGHNHKVDFENEIALPAGEDGHTHKLEMDPPAENQYGYHD